MGYPVQGVQALVVRLQEEAPEHVAITLVNEPAIALDEGRPVTPVITREIVPRDLREGMMDDVQIVVEKEQAQDR